MHIYTFLNTLYPTGIIRYVMYTKNWETHFAILWSIENWRTWKYILTIFVLNMLIFQGNCWFGPSYNYGLCANLAMGCSRSSPSRGSRHRFWEVLKIRPSPVLAIMEENQWLTAGWCQVLLFFSKTSVLLPVPEQNRTPNLVLGPVLQGK